MLNNNEISKLPILAREFCETFSKKFTNIEHTISTTDDLTITIQSANCNVGNLYIWIDSEDEIIIGLGDYFHKHFEVEVLTSTAKNTNNNDRHQTIMKAIQLIGDIVEEKVIIVITKHGKHIVNAGIYYQDELSSYSYVMPVKKKKSRWTLFNTFFNKEIQTLKYTWRNSF